MILLKDNKPIIQQECNDCEYGRINCKYKGKKCNSSRCKHKYCPKCSVGHIYTKIPDKFVKEVEGLLKVEKPKSGHAAANGLWQLYREAQQRLKEIETEILTNKT